MKELLMQYAEYNAWANRLIINAMLKLDQDRTEREIISSFLSLRKTVTHIWSAESIWLQRMKHVEQPIWQENNFNGSFEELCGKWQKASMTLQTFVAEQEESDFKEILAYKDRSGNSQAMSVYQVLLHTFNHSTYHRGQLITMMRQSGAMEIPATDFIWFVKRG